jgi:hypothetical protein
MATRSKYVKVKQTNPTTPPVNGGFNFGNNCLYNSTYKLIILTAPQDSYDSLGQNWIGLGSGSVFVYSYDEITRASSLVQKISMPDVSTMGIGSIRHANALFGISVDTFQDWLVIGCPGDIYTENLERNDRYDLIRFAGSTETPREITSRPSGSVYFYKWNGTSFEYVNKIRPPLYQDLANPVSEDLFSFFKGNYSDGALCGNASSFGFSVSIDKSSETSFISSSIPTKKLVAIGAPNSVGMPPEVYPERTDSLLFRGPYGGVWLASYNTSSLKWELASDKLTSYSFGNSDIDAMGASFMGSYHDIYNPSSSTYMVPSPAYDAKTSSEYFKFGTNVSIGFFNNIKLIVGSLESFRIEDTFGQFIKDRGNVYYYDLIYNPSNPQINSLVLNNPYGDRRFYTAIEYTNANLTPGTSQYAESITGYSSFLDRNAVADSSANVEKSVGLPYVNLSRSSAGFCGYQPVIGSTLQTDTGTDYVNDTRLFNSEGVGSGDIKQCGRLAFVSAPGMIRTCSKIYPLSDSYTASSYVTAFDSNTGFRVSAVENCESIIIVDLSDLNQLKTKGWILAGPNTWKINPVDFTWTGGFGRHFDVQQESSTQWVLTTTFLSSYEKEFMYSGSPSNDYVFIVKKAQLKTAIYRITYDGTSMSMQIMSVIDGKITNGGSTVAGFDNSSLIATEAIVPSISGYTNKNAYLSLHKMSPYTYNVQSLIEKTYNFVSPALIKNNIHNEYHIAEGWRSDNDGTTPTSACGSFYLTDSQSYTINGSAFLPFCE